MGKTLSAKGRIIFGDIEKRENEIKRLVALIGTNNQKSLNLEKKITTNLDFKLI